MKNKLKCKTCKKFTYLSELNSNGNCVNCSKNKGIEEKIKKLEEYINRCNRDIEFNESILYTSFDLKELEGIEFCLNLYYLGLKDLAIRCLSIIGLNYDWSLNKFMSIQCYITECSPFRYEYIK